MESMIAPFHSHKDRTPITEDGTILSSCPVLALHRFFRRDWPQLFPHIPMTVQPHFTNKRRQIQYRKSIHRSRASDHPSSSIYYHSSSSTAAATLSLPDSSLNRINHCRGNSYHRRFLTTAAAAALHLLPL